MIQYEFLKAEDLGWKIRYDLAKQFNYYVFELPNGDLIAHEKSSPLIIRVKDNSL